MMQELFGGASLIGGGERKPSISHVLEASPSPSPSPTPSPSSSTAAAAAAAASSSPAAENQNNLRCPRCDSSNTKFCYYNNYNLTQPRHFCKTCRRYWTKGGALRNVPIGGGCRKNKTAAAGIAAAVGKPSGSGGFMRLVKTASFSDEMGRSAGFCGVGGGGGGGFNQEVHSGPVVWAPPQSSHLMALLRAAAQNPNPNSISGLKEEESVMTGSQFTSESSMVATEALTSGSFWRSNQNQAQQQQQNHHQNPQIGFVLGEVQNNGYHEIYQRMRSTANYYPDHSSPLLLSNVATTTSSSSAILESAPVASGELGYWNQTLPSWSDLPTTTNGAYP